MRIISGSHKGRRLIAPKNLPVRPTTDFAKESLFNILNNQYDFDNLIVLDLFAGTGNISFEFSSRGAIAVTSVDAHKNCCLFIDKIATELDFPINTIKSDVFAFLKRHKGKYDIIFADPPYDFSNTQFEQIVSSCFDSDLLKDQAALIVEHSKHTDLTTLNHYNESRRYGSSSFSFFKK
ncbi:MAG: 16S rRNA (guanine(966)-N(2))-methyltransferase RsmD [Gilvibacter sp.]